jgi:hypothetical protein
MIKASCFREPLSFKTVWPAAATLIAIQIIMCAFPVKTGISDEYKNLSMARS